MEVTVNDNNVEHALRILKKKMQREGVYKDIKLHRRFEKPSVKRARKRTELARRFRKTMRKRGELSM
ncbi:MAG: 30S ribosomal protein S21 [Holosporales bacterium]|jgi:small subunit ribosomal protein S21|nr:30S ribosomal protein S21 [Holosporales bacterium]